MTETEIVLLMAKCVPVLLTVWIFVHLLCEEYLRALEARGLIRRVPPRVQTDDDATSPRGTTDAPDRTT